MATNPLGLQRSGDLQTDLDLIFANLQYLRDSLPQTTALTVDVRHASGAGFTPISNELSFPISSRVFFEAYILTDTYASEVPSANLLAMTGPSSNLIAYRIEQGLTQRGWNRASADTVSFYRIQGICEPSAPGLLQVTYQTSGTRTVYRTSHLTVSLL